MKKKILIIDDEKRFAEALRTFFEQNGYETLLAHDGASGFDLTQKETPALVLSDVLLPKLGGFNLCKKIKDDPALGRIPVILMTAVYKKTQYRTDAKQYGADDYILKPFEFDELLRKVESLLGPAKKPSKEQGTVMDRLQGLTSTYASELPAKVRKIETLLTRADGEWDREACATAHRMAHGLTGSGALFGYPDLSDAARDLEMALQTFMDSSAPPDASGRKLIRDLIEEIHSAAAKPGKTTP